MAEDLGVEVRGLRRPGAGGCQEQAADQHGQDEKTPHEHPLVGLLLGAILRPLAGDGQVPCPLAAPAPPRAVGPP
jgi:hypothetical protein